jgi:16S rRNA (guanine527-N7)-methyltransferase
MDLVKFWTICSSNAIVLTLEQLHSIERYANELKYWNSKVNLISRKDEDNIFERHILHSLSILKYVDMPAKSRVLDVGTGGGLPGIPIKIANPEIDLLMVDSINKKIKITKMFAQHTGLRKIEAKWIRTEDLAGDFENRRNFDFVVSRAVARIELIIDWTKLIVKNNTKYLLLKGGDLSEEIESAKNIYPELNIKEIDIDMLGVPYFKEDGKKLLICSFAK